MHFHRCFRSRSGRRAAAISTVALVWALTAAGAAAAPSPATVAPGAWVSDHRALAVYYQRRARRAYSQASDCAAAHAGSPPDARDCDVLKRRAADYAAVAAEHDRLDAPAAARRPPQSHAAYDPAALEY